MAAHGRAGPFTTAPAGGRAAGRASAWPCATIQRRWRCAGSGNARTVEERRGGGFPVVAL